MAAGAGRPLRVLRAAHHGVVSAWRERERELVRRGVDLTMVSATRWNEGGADIDLDPGDDDFVVGVGTLGTHPNGFLFDPRPLWRLLGEHWDLIDLHEEPCATQTAEVLALMRLRGVTAPVVMYAAQNIPKRYPIPIRWTERWALRRAANAYVCNVEAGRILQDKGLRAQPKLIGLGTDLDVFTPGAHDAPRTPLKVGYAGRLETYKGVDVLLRAIARTPDCTLEVAGDGPERDALTALADELGIAGRVDFRGHLGAQLPAFYRELDVLVVPSLPTKGWLEQFGRVVVEAMASGVPVISSASGALPEVVGDAGILVPPGDPDAIGRALTEVADPARWAALRAAGLEHCRQYSWAAIGERHRAFYDEVLAAEEPPQGDLPDPEVVVVAYGSPDPLRAALAPLAGFPITIVDNSSDPDTCALAEEFGAHYVDPGANLGFAAAVNIALRSLAERGRGAADVLLLNPDATIAADAVGALERELHADSRLACVAPRQTAPDSGTPDRVVWPFPSPLGAWLVALGLGRLDRRHGFVIGSILLLKGDALRDVGGFDERFFLYAEETDWQRRAVARGWRTGYVPAVVGTHVGAGTSSDSQVRSRLFHTSQLAYIHKHFGAAGEIVYRAATVAGAAVRSVLASGEARDDARWRLRFYLTAPRAGRGRAATGPAR
ncbi:glycosyltransferase [Propionicicella superfundia]|uniref:glycosyltransferase n=1 Tax=Propionicicella superfundia TaxID=348582 RepID=UPI001469BA79|nr:glycosyltransferase [Propionicicella superfundia]